jgi:hypothetical protein
MKDMLHLDEAWNGVDALALLRQPRLTPFLPNNFGRESGWVYWLMPYLLILGATTFAIRFAATVTGILTLAAAGRLGRELWGNRGAFWSVMALSVLYWHVHISQQALRANLYILLGTLAAGQMLYAYRINSRRAWVVGGVALGLLAYTYFASVGWIAYTGLLLSGIALWDRRRRWNIGLALLVAFLVVLPMMIYITGHPDQFFARPATVAVDEGGRLYNVQRWLDAWFRQGDMNHEFNLPGRPILDPITGVLAALGLVAVFGLSRRWSYGLILLGWGIVACIPSLVSNLAPHFLRASGMTVAIGLVIGAGAHLLGSLCQRITKIQGSAVLASLFLIPVAMRTYHDFHRVWIEQPETFVVMEQHINRATDYLSDYAPQDNYVYFSPFTPAHPVIAFRKADLAPRPVAAFDGHECLVLPAHQANYVSLTMYEPGFQQRLAQWATVTPLFVDSGSPTSAPRYSIFSATPPPDLGRYVANFGDALVVKLMHPLSTTISAGVTLPIVLGVQPLRTLDFAPILFVHLYGTPTPYEGGTLWAQADSQLCVSYPAHLWRTEETIIQLFALDIPPDIPPDVYTIAIGIFPFPAGERLPISDGDASAFNYLTLHHLTITAEDAP